MTIIVKKDLEKPTYCPICNAQLIDHNDKRNKPAIVYVYAVAVVSSSKQNSIGFLCRNCGYYKLDFEVKIGDE